ncbi:MAG: hypothetical protein J6B37_04980 [Clostridia bacterium]|nr:hypothetical protein [Clostridia bacterium]
MSYHEFGIIETPPKKGKRYDKYEAKKYKCISVNDDDIENIIKKLSDIDFYWHTLDVAGKGLAYCGITLISPSSMQSFISVIDDIPELHSLKELLLKALNENKWIIHFGL